MYFHSVAEVLEFALKREEDSACFYARMREATPNPALKELLTEMENEEKRHGEILKGLSGKPVEALAVKPVTDLKISDFVVPEPPNPEMSFQDLLVLAARKEAKAAELYAHLRDHASDPEHKKLFEFLAMQEKGHKLKLESEYETHVMPED